MAATKTEGGRERESECGCTVCMCNHERGFMRQPPDQKDWGLGKQQGNKCR